MDTKGTSFSGMDGQGWSLRKKAMYTRRSDLHPHSLHHWQSQSRIARGQLPAAHRVHPYSWTVIRDFGQCTISVSCCSNKLGGSKQHKFSYGSEMGLTGLETTGQQVRLFWEALGENPFYCLFQLLDAARSLVCGCLFHLQSQQWW